MTVPICSYSLDVSLHYYDSSLSKCIKDFQTSCCTNFGVALLALVYSHDFISLRGTCPFVSLNNCQVNGFSLLLDLKSELALNFVTESIQKT